jgi:hypothetical protein
MVVDSATPTEEHASAPNSPLRRTFELLMLGVLPLALVAAFTLGVVHDHFAFDFHTFWQAGRDVLHGRSPYPSPGVVAHAHPVDGAYEYFVYPPPFVLALLPLAAIPFAPAAAVYTIVLLLSLAAALAILDIRDWRCYGVAFASIPALSAFRLGAVTPILVLLTAVAWRYRDRWVMVGSAVAGAVLIKLFLWPLVGWLLVTRRWKAAALATVGGVGVTLVAWAGIGFHGLRDYPALLRSLTHSEAARSYSLVALADRLSFPDPQISWLLIAISISAVLLVACVRAPVRERDRAVYTGAILLALLLTPIVWLHYFALLLTPIAIREKRFSAWWLIPLAYWLSPITEPERHPLWRLALVLGLALALTARHSRATDATAQRS